MKKIAITGHTSGIGAALYNYFIHNNYTVQGFSRSNGYDISVPMIRDKIIAESDTCDIFINNAYNNWDDSQLQLLQAVNVAWQNQNKIIFNIGSRYVQDDNIYCQHKQAQDIYCQQFLYQKAPQIINIKPGLIDTPRMQSVTSSEKLPPETVVEVVDWIIKQQRHYRVSCIIFGS